jgi:hypothetical protein
MSLVSALYPYRLLNEYDHAVDREGIRSVTLGWILAEFCESGHCLTQWLALALAVLNVRVLLP